MFGTRKNGSYRGPYKALMGKSNENQQFFNRSKSVDLDAKKKQRRPLLTSHVVTNDAQRETRSRNGH